MSDLFVDNIKHQSSQGSGTITLGTSGETIALASGASVTGNGLVGITMADQFRYTASTASPSGDITTNLERVDTDFDKIGTGMTLSSGVFSFPETGIYLVLAQADINFTNQADNACIISTMVTTNNSSYNERARVFAGSNSSSNNSRFTCYSQVMIDVTDISNVKVKFNASSFAAGSRLEGATDINMTSFTFIRLGDT